MPNRPVEIIKLPAEVVVKSHGFSLDIGGSVFKLVYRTKEDYEDAKAKKDTEMSQVRLVSFSRAELEEGLQYIRDEVYISPKEGELLPTMFSCGVGSSQYRTKFKKELGCDVNNLAEFDCFINAMQYQLRTATREQLLHPLLVEATREPIETTQKILTKYAAIMNDFSSVEFKVDEQAVKTLEVKDKFKDKKVDKPIAESEDIYPYMLGMCGSGFAFMKISKDGKFEIIDGSNRGGRCFYGLGCLLTGCKSFDELVDLAAKGNSQNIDVGTVDLAKEFETAEEDETDMYSKSMRGEDSEDNNLLYCFGKAVGASISDFSKADLAATLLHMAALDLVTAIHYCAKDQGCKRVYFAGSFPSAEIIRFIITREFTRRNCMTYTMKGLGEGIPFDFVRSGGHLGALGAFINSESKYLKQAIEDSGESESTAL